MCRHCVNLTEDKRIVHQFMVVAAKRLSDKFGIPISPDELSVEISLTVIDPPKSSAMTGGKIVRMLDEMNK